MRTVSTLFLRGAKSEEQSRNRNESVRHDRLRSACPFLAFSAPDLEHFCCIDWGATGQPKGWENTAPCPRNPARIPWDRNSYQEETVSCTTRRNMCSLFLRPCPRVSPRAIIRVWETGRRSLTATRSALCMVRNWGHLFPKIIKEGKCNKWEATLHEFENKGRGESGLQCHQGCQVQKI